VLLTLALDDESRDVWVQKFRRRSVMTSAGPYEFEYRDKTVPLGFSLKLDEFHIGQYPGTRRPRSFESHVTITDATTGREQARIISMNNPTKYAGYSLFQSSYNLAGGQRTSYLSVSRDPGLPIVFAGYIIVMVGLIVVVVTRLVDRRRGPPVGGMGKAAVVTTTSLSGVSAAGEPIGVRR
jgi:cytochrome c biogenesis protein ResB